MYISINQVRPNYTTIKPVLKDHLYLKTIFELQTVFLSSVIYCAYSRKILIAHMDTIIILLPHMQ